MSDQTISRPQFMETLGLLPPYSPEDVEAAFRDRAMKVHPDRGGTMDAFLKLNEAYRLAREYVKFRAGRRQWLALQVERYARQEEVIAAIEQLGGSVELDHYDWIKQSVGDDFAAVAQRILKVEAHAPNSGTALAKVMAANVDLFDHLVDLDVSGTGFSDGDFLFLEKFTSITRINLARTNVTSRTVELIERWPQLIWMSVSRSKVGLMQRFWLWLKYRRKKKDTANSGRVQFE
jgi:curved DNA-binding protein CbpA